MQMTSNKQTVNEQKSTSTVKKAAQFSRDSGFSAGQWVNSKLRVLVSLKRTNPTPPHAELNGTLCSFLKAAPWLSQQCLAARR